MALDLKVGTIIFCGTLSDKKDEAKRKAEDADTIDKAKRYIKQYNLTNEDVSLGTLKGSIMVKTKRELSL